MNDKESIWLSVYLLAFFNVILLGTVLIFRSVYRKRERIKEVEERHASKFLNRWMREYWIWLTEPVVDLFIFLKLTPNRITTVGVLISFLSGYFFAVGHLGLGGWLMIFSATFDMFDGSVARKTGQVTASGAYYDSVMDRVSEGAIFAGLAFLYRDNWGLFAALAALMGSVMVSYSRARGDAAGMIYAGGSMQRPERIVYLGVGAIFTPIVSHFLAIWWPWAIPVNLYLIPLSFVAVATWMTSFHRISHVMGMLDEK